MDITKEITILVEQLRELDFCHELLNFWPLSEGQAEIAAMNDRFWDRGKKWPEEPDVVVRAAVLDAYQKALEAAVGAIKEAENVRADSKGNC